KELDDEEYRVRERASEELTEIGLLAREALEAAAKRGSLEVQYRARDLLRHLKGTSNLAPERLRARRAVEVLERVGTPAACEVLPNMLQLRLDAGLEPSIKDSLERLGVNSGEQGA